jgi:guanylate kinase
MQRQGNLFVISGPSGVGKGTIIAAMLARTDNISLSISATTRSARCGEVEGRDYFFVTTAQFKRMIEADELLEYADVYGNMYGTPRSFVLNKLEQGQDIILEIDIQGAMQIKEKISTGIFIFIMPPSGEDLSARLIARGTDAPETIERRLKAYESEISHINDYDYVIVNDEVEKATLQLQAIVIAERCKVINQYNK